MANELIITAKTELVTGNLLAQAGQAANRAASGGVFEDYRSRIAENTRLRQDADLRLFEQFLQEMGVYHCQPVEQQVPLSGKKKDSPAMAKNIECWRGMTWGLVEAFVKYMLLQEGYAIGSINVRLATIKRYCELATKAGVIERAEFQLIKAVEGYGYSEGINIDKQREVTRRKKTYTGQAVTKKATSVVLSKQQVKALFRLPNPRTPQGRRDTLLLGLLLDHGLRCGEVAALTVGAIDLESKTLTFYRPKVKKAQTLNLTDYTFKAAKAYLALDASIMLDAPLLMGSTKSGKLAGTMSERAINKRIGALGEAIGIDNLSPHDCRHTWATWYARDNVDPFRLQEMGGWSSLAMPRHYIEDARIANEGANLNVYGIGQED